MSSSRDGAGGEPRSRLNDVGALPQKVEYRPAPPSSGGTVWHGAGPQTAVMCASGGDEAKKGVCGCVRVSYSDRSDTEYVTVKNRE